MQLNQNRIRVMHASLALVLAAGSAAALAGPEGASQTKKNGQRQSEPARTGTLGADRVAALHFVRSGELIGADLENRAGESLGSIENLIVDRGSGHIVFAVVKSGDFLGLGGKSFAMPYRDLAFRPADDVFTADMTPEQVERQTEFLPENWTDLTTTGWMADLRNWVSDDAADTREEKIRQAVREQDGRPIEGQIVAIDRSGYGEVEDAKVTVRTESGDHVVVVLGPSWYVFGSENAPYRGDRVDLVAVDVDGTWYATEARVDGTDMPLRNDDGATRWSTNIDKETPRYFLLTDLVGRSVEIAGSTSGEVQTAVVECRSGSVAFIGLDPNENFLGMGDSILLTPWSVLRIDSRLGVSLDSDPAGIEGGMKVPDDLRELSTPAALRRAYSAFDVEPARFEQAPSRRPEQMQRESRSGDAWGRDAAIVKLFANGEKIEFGGTVRDQSTRAVAGGAPDAWVLTIDTEAGEQRQVVVAPGWFMSRQKASFQPGDFVVVQGRSARIGNEDWVGAWTIKHGDRMYTYWNGDRPVWSE